MVSYAAEARQAFLEDRGGTWVLESKDNMPEFFRYLFDGFNTQPRSSEEELEMIRFQLKAMLLILEGNHPDLIEKILALDCGVGNFYYWSLDEPERIEAFRDQLPG